jgi:hypothetical protein
MTIATVPAVTRRSRTTIDTAATPPADPASVLITRREVALMRDAGDWAVALSALLAVAVLVVRLVGG